MQHVYNYVIVNRQRTAYRMSDAVNGELDLLFIYLQTGPFCPGWQRPASVDQEGLGPGTLQPVPPESWEYRCVS